MVVGLESISLESKYDQVVFFQEPFRKACLEIEACYVFVIDFCINFLKLW